MDIISSHESNVRIYSRLFPAIFASARSATVVDENGNEYIDFFCGAGALNYGHNPPLMKQKLIEYLERDGVTHSLDMTTSAKAAFLRRFEEVILRPRQLSYKVQFTAPTGADAVEAALKLARKATGRQKVVYFADAYHGVTLGALAVTANRVKRGAAGIPLENSVMIPFDGDCHEETDSLNYLEFMLARSELPAAIIVETIQAEGGVKVASFEWLLRLEHIARQYEVILIVDEIQVGCGRTGTFFSFEPVGISPDIICLSKSISGMGLPMALALIKPELDVWSPGEHVGTFRGNNLAFVTARQALAYWEDDSFAESIAQKATTVRQWMVSQVLAYPKIIAGARGRGLIQGIVFTDGELASKVARSCFEMGLIIETAGPADDVLKIMPPLTITQAELTLGLQKIEDSLDAVASGERGKQLILAAS